MVQNFKPCKTPNCDYGVILDDGCRLDCPLCDVSYCVQCDCEWHYDLTCNEFQQEINQIRIYEGAYQNDHLFF